MKMKKILSLIVATVVCLSSFTAFSADELIYEKSNEQLEVFYNDEIISFDVEPIIEDGRTLVPMRTIFETMGCAVYYSVNDGISYISVA